MSTDSQAIVLAVIAYHCPACETALATTLEKEREFSVRCQKCDAKLKYFPQSRRILVIEVPSPREFPSNNDEKDLLAWWVWQLAYTTNRTGSFCRFYRALQYPLREQKERLIRLFTEMAPPNWCDNQGETYTFQHLPQRPEQTPMEESCHFLCCLPTN